MTEEQQQDNINAKNHLFGLFCIFMVTLMIFLMFGILTGLYIIIVSVISAGIIGLYLLRNKEDVPK
jgi:hypothetical protein